MKSLLSIFLFLFTLSCLSQKERYLSFELAGSGGLASFNYELSLFSKPMIRNCYDNGKEKFNHKLKLWF